MKKRTKRCRWGALLALLLLSGASGCKDQQQVVEKPVVEMPAQAKHWVKASPFSFAAAKGEVVLVEAWHPS